MLDRTPEHVLERAGRVGGGPHGLPIPPQSSATPCWACERVVSSVSIEHKRINRAVYMVGGGLLGLTVPSGLLVHGPFWAAAYRGSRMGARGRHL